MARGVTYLASAAAALYGNVTLWTSRAGAAWGASGIWNSGPSYQSQLTTLQGQYSTLQGQYNAMVAERDLWQARANGVYVGGQWGVGETWQAAYNRVLPEASVHRLAATLPGNTYSGAWAPKASIAVDRTGYWKAGVNGNLSDASIFDFFIRFNYAGTAGAFALIRNHGATTQWGWTNNYDNTAVLLSSGQVISFEVLCGVSAGMGGDFWVTFVPTPTYPH